MSKRKRKTDVADNLATNVEVEVVRISNPTEVTFSDVPQMLFHILDSMDTFKTYVRGSIDNLNQLVTDLQDKTEEFIAKQKRVEIIEKKIQEIKMNLQMKPDKKWLTLPELIEFLPTHPKVTTIYTWMRQNKIPYYKLGKEALFLVSDIDEWMKEERVISMENWATQSAEEYIKSHPKK